MLMDHAGMAVLQTTGFFIICKQEGGAVFYEDHWWFFPAKILHEGHLGMPQKSVLYSWEWPGRV